MIRLVLVWLFCVNLGTAAVGQRLIWENGMTLLGFFNKHHIDPKIYYNLSYQDKELGTEIRAGVPYYVLKDDNNQLLQVLVPVGESVQLRLYKDSSGQYNLDFIPIIYSSAQKTLTMRIKHSPYHDILKATGDAKLAQEFIGIYKKTLNLKRAVIKDDQLSLIYTRKYRLNQPFGYPSIKAAMLQTHRRNHYVFAYRGKYYDEMGREVVEFLLETPVRYTRISSRFSLGRMHPILKQVRPHFGVDFAAKKGSLIHAATDGYIVSMGRKGGYGNAIEIKHGQDLRMVYAHMSAFARGLHMHSYVKRGQVIGRVGSTGLSTGPHLHFGVYRNDRPIDPLGRIRTAKSQLSGHEKQLFSQAIKPYLKSLEDMTSFEYAQKENTKNTD
ncbi:PG-modifying enzyme, HdpA [Helicobacter ailurogastricus]|uniref:peptidoglycan DD-metalloendopeptidase family protein n=1 Tax=Helicobacter ailurogastricus TaxID=1578720 RepID=UPI00244D947B|nr:peptidoglycan DD-metalloendopeptidase family protein [Helicobacter ailurogastricus]GMB89569.1 PG-modifying enzyme, HdpA [Helicobacter ailurogastricus]